MALGSDLMLKLIIAAQDATAPAITSARQGIQSLSTTAEKVYEAAKAYLTFQIASEGVAKLKEGLQSVLETGGQFEKFGASLNSAMGGKTQGREAFEWIKQFAKDTPFELDGVTKAFLKLKAFGLDPMDGSLKALAEQTAKTAGGQAELEGIVLAMGQAFAKQKFQAEEANQLLERGVPVWDMLAKIMGKSTAEVIALSQAGQVGRTEIKALIDEIGRSADGSLAGQMTTWNGLVSNLKDNWTQFLNTVAESGALDYFKAQITALNQQFASMGASGELQAKAERISAAFVSMGQSVSSAVGFVVKNFDTLKNGAEALAGVYVGKLVQGTLSYVAAATAAAAATRQAAAAKGAAVKVDMEALQAAQAEAVARANIARAALADAINTAAKKSEITKLTRDLTAAERAQEIGTKRLADGQRVLAEANYAAATSATLAQKAMGGLSALSAAFGPLVAAVMSLKFAWDEVGAAIDDYKTRQRLYSQGLQDSAAAHTALNEKIRATLAETKGFADQAILTGNQFTAQTQQQGAAYVDNLQKAQRYWLAVATQAKESGNQAAMAEAETRAEAYGNALDRARAKLASLHAEQAKPAPAAAFSTAAIDAYAKALNGAKDEFDKYAKGLSSGDLTSIIDSARQRLEAVKVATGGNTEAMQRWQGVIDSALRETMTRAGLDAERALTGVSSELRKGIADTEALGKALAASGMDAQKAGQIMVNALSGLLSKAKTTDDLNLIKAKLDELSSSAQTGTPLFSQLAGAYTQLHEAQKKTAASSADVASAQEKAWRSAQAAELTQREIASATAARHRAQEQANAAAHARAQQRHIDAQQEIHDGESVSRVWDLASIAMLQFGNAGEKALQYLSRLSWLSGSFDNYFRWTREWTEAAQKQQDAVDRLEANLRQATSTGRGLDQAIAQAAGNFDHLDAQRLTGLNAALDAARAKMLALEESTRQTLNSLQDELDQLNGNTAAIERRRYEEQRAKLAQAANEARAAGDRTAFQNATEAQQIADEIYRRKQSDLAGKTKPDASHPGNTVATLGTMRVVLDSPGSGKIAVGNFAPDQYQNLVDVLKYHGQTA